MRKFRLGALCLIACLFAAVFASAEEPKEQGWRMFIANETSFRMTPLGIGDTARLAWQYHYSDSDNILFKSNHIGLGIVDSFSPANNGIGAYVEFEPIAVFNLRVQYEYQQYFGILNSVVDFPNKNSDYSDSVLDDIDDDDMHWATGHHLSIQPKFQVMFKGFIALDTPSFEWFDINRNFYFYEPTNDTLVKNNDFMFLNMAVLARRIWGSEDASQMFLGVRHAYLRVESTGRERQQLDGLFIWMMGKKVWIMENPLLFAVCGGYLEDRYREKDVFAAVVYSFEYSLKPKMGAR